MSVVEVSADYGGRPLTLQTGRYAKQADASIWAKYGDTVVLVSVCSSRKLTKGQDFLPLTVDFQEKYFAAGRIPGGFFKREAKPSERATLSARLIDRPIRPLFPEDYFYDTFVTATVLSTDGVNEPDILASIATSAALHISDIPWNGPIGTCRVGLVNGEMVCNIVPTELPNSQMDLLVSGVRSGVIMVEGSSKEISEKQMMDAIEFAHQQMQPIMDLQDELRRKLGKTKREYEKPVRDDKLKTEMRTFLWPHFEKAFAVREKLARYEALAKAASAAEEKFASKEGADEARDHLVGLYTEELKATFARELTVNSKKRIDGRSYTDIRPISVEAGILPRVHGSAVFQRGETQVLSAITLGTADDEQKIDAISGTYQKSFLLHYNFPPFSVGEARPLRPPGRREVGHGFLAERALSFIIPSKEVFPYTIRLVAEVLESNGSSSMATVCSGSLALMDAGVPIPKPVAGVAMGLIKEGNKVAVLSDILGDEDHLGDMDFKVCGTAEGVTAFQMDLKIGGVERIIMEQALEQAREGRLHMLGHMNGLLDKPREQFSIYAPRIFTIKVRPDKVREVIGSGGKVVRGIIEKTGVKIDIEDDGTIHVASADDASAKAAIEMINQIVEEAEPGRIYEGKVSRIADFGAFIEIIPGTDGLCHISELDLNRVRRVEDVLNVGDIVRVKCLEVDPSGKIRLSRKAVLLEQGSDEDSADSEGGEGGGTEAAPSKAVADDEEALLEALGPEDRKPREDRPIEPRGDRMPRDRGDRDFRGGRGGGGDRDNRERGGHRHSGDRDRGGHRSSSERDRGPSRSAGDREGRGDRDRGPSRGGSHRGGPSRSGGGFGGGRPGPDRGERSGSDRGDRGGRGDSDRGGYRDRGPAPERTERGFDSPRRERPPMSSRPAGGGDDRGNRRDRPDRENFGNREERGGRDRDNWDRMSRWEDEDRGNRYRDED